ncbi:hypothetical protein [Sulfurimonas sp.]|uniref:hypothetical protein n=1 Tax=Sulfurimonas sp. TaxID=2022749 RepID=UPI0035685EF8
MKIIDIEKKTNHSSVNIVRWLSHARPIKLSVAREIANTMKFPITIFEKAEVQIKYLGKSYLQENNNTPQNSVQGN